MRALRATRFALSALALLATIAVADADDLPPLPKPSTATSTATAPTPIAPATRPDAVRARLAIEARVKALKEAGQGAEKPASKASLDLLAERSRLLAEWEKAKKDLEDAEDPAKGPDRESSEAKADLEKSRALLEQSSKAPDMLLPEGFGVIAGPSPAEGRLAEMKEAIDSARADLKEQSTALESLRADGARTLTAEVSALRVARDKAHQACVALAARRVERESAVALASSPDAREMARDRLANFEWESRVESLRLAAMEAKIALMGRQVDLVGLKIQAKAARVELARRTVERMEARYASIAERRQVDLKRDIVKAETEAARSVDPIARDKARRDVELLALEAQAVAYEKAAATASGPSLQAQTTLADEAEQNFVELKKLMSDGNVSPLDVLRLKNDYRRIVPERAQVVRTDLAASEAELTTYENALTEAEIALVNDARDDRFDRESLLEQTPEKRRAEAVAMLDQIEAKHRALLNRVRTVLQKLSARAEETHHQVTRRIDILDQQYAFIRTHIFWLRDAEPVGPSSIYRARDESIRTAKALAKMTVVLWDRRAWGRPNIDFTIAMAALALLPWPIHLARRALDRSRLAASPEAGIGRIGLRALRRVLIGLTSSAAWPAYLALGAFAAKSAPWPRELAWPVSALLLGLSMAVLATIAGRMAFRNGGWAEGVLLAPRDVTRQMRRVVLTLAVAGYSLLMPSLLLEGGWIAPGGRPVSASALPRLMVFAFLMVAWVLAYRLLRRASPLLDWLTSDPERSGWLGRHRRAASASVLTALALILVLDGAGYRFTTRRLAFGLASTSAMLAACWGTYRLLLWAIDRHAWRWPGTGTSADPSAPDAEVEGLDAKAKLRTLAKVAVWCVGIFATSIVWNVDLALFRTIGEQTLWKLSDRSVTVGDGFQMAAVVFVTAGVWRYLNTFFALAVFPRMPDDPGVRFAVLTLCRYAVLAVGVVASLSAIHLGLEKIGVVLAALGVGLGFGLQEIVSNFVSGIILLLERPIRVGDLVTVASMTGKVDRINIRATTIINGDNQSMIIPNREFITGSLINWTHHDRIVRVTIKVNVALGTDADKVTDLLLAIAQADPDALNNPVPNALLDAIGDSSLNFILYAFVPDPSLQGRVKHRLYGEIQRRFDEAGIVIPLPVRELRVQAAGREADADLEVIARPQGYRLDRAEAVPPAPRFVSRPPLPVPAEECHRGVDE